MLKYKEFDVVSVKEKSDAVAEMLSKAGIRFTQRISKPRTIRPVFVIAVHPDDVTQADQVQMAARQREFEDFARSLSFVRRPFSDKDMLVAREPNDAGYYISGIYHGEVFDETKFRVVKGGWDHAHCYICCAKVLPGDEWWATLPPNYEDEIGLCMACHARLFGSEP